MPLAREMLVRFQPTPPICSGSLREKASIFGLKIKVKILVTAPMGEIYVQRILKVGPSSPTNFSIDFY